MALWTSVPGAAAEGSSREPVPGLCLEAWESGTLWGGGGIPAVCHLKCEVPVNMDPAAQ